MRRPSSPAPAPASQTGSPSSSFTPLKTLLGCRNSFFYPTGYFGENGPDTHALVREVLQVLLLLRLWSPRCSVLKHPGGPTDPEPDGAEGTLALPHPAAPTLQICDPPVRGDVDEPSEVEKLRLLSSNIPNPTDQQAGTAGKITCSSNKCGRMIQPNTEDRKHGNHGYHAE